jgi:hypothetical protein
MKTVVSTALIILATAALMVCLLEVFLTDSQKHQINDMVLRFCNNIDELKARRLLDWLQAWRPWLLSAGVLLAAAFILWTESRNQRTGPFGIADIIPACVAFGPGVWFGWKVARWILRATTLFWAVARATLSIIVSFLPLPLLGAIAKLFVLPILPSIAIPQPTLGIALLQLLIVTGFVASTFFTALAFIFWCPVGIPLAVIYIVSVLIYIAEFALRRIAEYPRGTIVAIALILGALVVFLKAIN